MKVRKLSLTGEPLFGYPSGQFWQDQVEGVAQAISMRLKLLQGEWFLDATQGVPYATNVLGRHTQAQADLVFRQTILDTQGVTRILSFISSLDPTTRKYSMACAVVTQFGQVGITFPLL